MPDMSPIQDPLYFSGQGEAYLGPEGGYDPDDGEGARWIGDLTSISLTLSEQATETKETWSSTRSIAVRNVTERSGTVAIVFRRFSPKNVALALGATEVADAAGTLTDFPIGNPDLNLLVKLPHEGISSVVITDSSTAGAVLPTDQYVVDEDHGAVMITDKTTGGAYVMPFLVSCSYKARTRLPIFKVPTGTRFGLLFLSKNTAVSYDPDANNPRPLPSTLELYSVEIPAGTELSLIGDEIQGFTLTATIKLDTSKASDAALGQFGYLSMVTPDSGEE